MYVCVHIYLHQSSSTVSTLLEILNNHKHKEQEKNKKGDRLRSVQTIKYLQTAHEEMENYKQQCLNLPKFYWSNIFG